MLNGMFCIVAAVEESEPYKMTENVIFSANLPEANSSIA